MFKWAKSFFKSEEHQQKSPEDIEKMERKMNTCLVRIRNKSIVKGRPVNRSALNGIPLELPCPLANSKIVVGGVRRCPMGNLFWECDQCGGLIYFIKPKDNLPIRLYFCDCGSAPIGELTFRCYADSHGPNFVQFEANALAGILQRYQKFNEKNLLILGETGVGKSTWINALANLLTFRTMDEALEAEKPVCLIPAQFFLTDDQMESRAIRICQHGVRLECEECKQPIVEINENLSGADSCTQFPMGHVFTGIKGGRLRIIDTPGIGDTGGIERDKENLNNIISYISTLDQIDCICILLKSNQARLGIAFRYCLQELLASLHRNAAKNIVFWFTNARGTLYRPGDTLNPLKIQLGELAKKTGVHIELKQDNVYCVDNEAFRFLCAVKANIPFSEVDYKNFSESWRRSDVEFDRLLNYMSDYLAPHCTSETASLNESRFIILNLSKPLAVASNTIQTNIVKIQEEEERLKGLDTEASDFKSKLETKRFYYDAEELEEPCTVCVNCAEVGQTKAGIPETIYKARCHDPCGLDGIPRNTPHHPGLQKCYAMNADGMCNECGCKWDVHMHIWYLQKIKFEKVDDPEVKRMLDNNANKKETLQTAIENLKKKVKEWEAEQTFINEVAAKASDFLKKNSIVPYNDAVEEYLKMQINEVRRQDESIKDYRRLEGLENSLKVYQMKKGIVEESLMSNQNQQKEALTPDDIKKFVHQLFELPLCGEQIKNFFNAEKRGRNVQREFKEKVFLRNAPKRASDKSQNRIHPSTSAGQFLRGPTRDGGSGSGNGPSAANQNNGAG